MIQTLLKTFEAIHSDKNRVAPPSACAEVIYEAATDGTNKLRYTAGNDAEAILALKNGATDEEYFERVKQAFGF